MKRCKDKCTSVTRGKRLGTALGGLLKIVAELFLVTNEVVVSLGGFHLGQFGEDYKEAIESKLGRQSSRRREF